MECLSSSAANLILRQKLLTCASNRNKNRALKLRVKASLNDNSLFQEAFTRASIRFQETNKPEPLFIDPYAGCLVPCNAELDLKYHQKQYQYCLATRFIDDKLLTVTNDIEGVKQVVLLSDGMDTRPYRLKWPLSTILYDVSSDLVFKTMRQKLEDVQAKIPRSTLLYHVSSDSSNIEEALRQKGFSGNRPSIWALQGLPLTDLASFEEILFIISSLAMKGCYFIGELPDFMTEDGTVMKSATTIRTENLFMNYGFRVDIITYEDIAKNLRKEPVIGDDCNRLLFIAEQLRFSDDQMETWRTEMQRAENEGDEDSFEDL